MDGDNLEDTLSAHQSESVVIISLLRFNIVVTKRCFDDISSIDAWRAPRKKAITQKQYLSLPHGCKGAVIHNTCSKFRSRLLILHGHVNSKSHFLPSV